MCGIPEKHNLRSLKELENSAEDRISLQRIKNNLRAYGFGGDLETLDSFLADNKKFISDCSKLLPFLPEKKAIILITESKEFIWNFHKYFPVLFALNFLGKSVFRTTMKLLIDRLLDKETSDSLFQSINQNLVIFSDLLRGDNRITAMESSIEGILTSILYTRKVIFTAQSSRLSEKEACNDVMYKIRSLYSSEIEAMFMESTRPVVIRTCAGDNLWL